MFAPTPLWSLRFFSLLALIGLVACSGPDDSICGGIVSPTRIVTVSPVGTLAIDVGTSGSVTVSVTGGCSDESQQVTWTSSNSSIATVNSANVVTAVGVGTVTLTATAFDNIAKQTVTLTVRPRVATLMDLRPNVDTLSPLGTRALTSVVTDQRGDPLVNPVIVYRSLTPSLASVSSAGLVTAIANGVARIAGAIGRPAADSLRDTVVVNIVAPCTLVRPVAFGSTYTGRFDASSCRGTLGFGQLDQFALSATTQTYYQIRLTPSIGGSLVPLNIGSGFYGTDVAANASVISYGVMRAGTFGFIVAAQSASAPGTYTAELTLNPDPRATCSLTDVTTGVSFQTAIVPASCPARTIRILPALQAGQVVNITARSVSFPVQLELRRNDTGALIVPIAAAAAAGGTATIAFTNPGFVFAVLRLSGGTSSNDLVTITIAQ